jgi:hypothetical protein
MIIIDPLSQQLQTPDKSLFDHLKQKQLDLACHIQAAKKVYLDTKFWILFRDARLGRDVGRDTVALLNLLEAGAAKGKVVCPISADTYVEIFQQRDRVTLRACARLIDDLSMGVAIILLMDRISLEVLHFIRRGTKGPEAVHATEQLIWIKIPYVLGFKPLALESPSPELELDIQKAWLDHYWTTTATERLDVIANDAEPLANPFPDISDDLNRIKVDYHHENKSFKQLFLSELWGALDPYTPYFEEIMAYIYEKETGQRPGADETAKQVCGRKVADMIFNGFRLNKFTREFPSLWLGAGFHAAVRWDLRRKYKAHDLSDFRHAVAAIPYCDYFLTDRSLRNLVSDKNLRLETLFPCKTFSDPSCAAGALAAVCS